MGPNKAHQYWSQQRQWFRSLVQAATDSVSADAEEND